MPAMPITLVVFIILKRQGKLICRARLVHTSGTHTLYTQFQCALQIYKHKTKTIMSAVALFLYSGSVPLLHKVGVIWGCDSGDRQQ